MPTITMIAGRYELKELISQGGMGFVYLAHDTVVGRDVALKTLISTADPIVLRLFFREWRVLSNLHHPNIVEIFDAGEFAHDGVVKPFFVMPLLQGATLDRWIQDTNHIGSMERLVDIFVQTARGLHAAHQNGLVHRDVKPSNIFVLDCGDVKLIDFGIAHLVGSQTTGLKGTLGYMAPEQVEHQECSPASDIFSLGVVCYEVLTGRRPFHASTAEEGFESLLHHTPPPASESNPAIGQSLSCVIQKAMAKRPAHRFANALEFAQYLQMAIRNEPIDYLNPQRLQARMQRARRAFEEAKNELAAEILAELGAEGHLDPALAGLRGQIEGAMRAQKIHDLLTDAKTAFAKHQYDLAAHYSEQVLRIAPEDEEALDIQRRSKTQQAEDQIDELLQMARSSIESRDYFEARRSLQQILVLKPNDGRASNLLG